MRPVFLQNVDGAVAWWNSLPAWLWILLILVVAIVVGYVVERAAIAILKSWAKRTRMQLDDVIVNAAHPALAVLTVVGLVWVGIHALPITYRPSTLMIIDNASMTIVFLGTAFGVARLLRGLFQLGAKKKERWQQLAVTGSRLVTIIVYIIAFLLILGNYGIDITPLIASLGIGALAVGLALQDTLANFFSGLWIQAQRTLQPGHYVRIEGQDLEGFVEQVGWRTTRLRTLPGNLVDVPNAKMAQSIVQDFYLPEPKMGTSITIVTGFEADPERVVPMLLEEATRAADEVSYVLKDPGPSARLNKVVDNGWEYWMGFWVPYYYNQWNAQGYVLNRIRQRFLKEGIRMPYPVRESINVPHERRDLNDAVTAANTNGHHAIQDGLRAPVADAHQQTDGRVTIVPPR